MKKYLCFVLAFVALNAFAQLPPAADSAVLLLLNQQIDRLVVNKNVAELDSLYVPDFIFSHGSGGIEGKNRWFTSVAKNNYPVRNHDSVTVEQHRNLAILKGQMYIERVDKDKLARYRLWYVRVFEKRVKRWELVSHYTFKEIHY